MSDSSPEPDAPMQPAADALPRSDSADFLAMKASLGPQQRRLHQGRVGVDGFHGGGFDAKLERERRYGEVFSFDEHAGGCFLQIELPRTLPDSACARSLEVAGKAPRYACSAEVVGALLIARGSLVDPQVRKAAAVSSAFPPDFQTEVELPRASGWRVAYRVAEGRFEVAALRE